MEVASFLETLISIYQFTCLYIPTDSNLHHHPCENLNSYAEITVFQDVTPCTEHSSIMSPSQKQLLEFHHKCNPHPRENESPFFPLVFNLPNFIEESLNCWHMASNQALHLLKKMCGCTLELFVEILALALCYYLSIPAQNDFHGVTSHSIVIFMVDKMYCV